MSVIMTLQVTGDPKAMEQYASDNTDRIRVSSKRQSVTV